LDGTMGAIMSDAPENPKSICIHMADFWYFAGDPHTPWAQGLIGNTPPFGLIMPSAPGWLEKFEKKYGEHLQPFTRYSFSTESLTESELIDLWDKSPHKENIIPMDSRFLENVQGHTEIGFEINQFQNPQNFLKIGFGFAFIQDGQVQGVAYTFSVSTKGIDVSIWVAERQRQQGIATALASRLLLESLHHGVEPHWDAANGESVKLAKKLGYTFIGTYDAYSLE